MASPMSAMPRSAGSGGGSGTGAGTPLAGGMFYGPTVHGRGGLPMTGVAIIRTGLPTGGVVFSPWGAGVPWYGGGFGWGVGYLSYDPWLYGSTSWVWGRYGMWPYDPIYSPDFFGSYGFSPGYGGAILGTRSTSMYREMGGLRLRIDPSSGQVYVDGVLQGSVEDFNGLTKHLQVEAGEHLLEVKAAGYETYSTQISVSAGKTVTYRASLKKKK
jgi:hypothetical protein